MTTTTRYRLARNGALIISVASATTGTAMAGAHPAAATGVAPGAFRYTQAQMQAAVAKYDPQQAAVLGAIAMAETGGSVFPTCNPTGCYHGPWAFQAAWAAGQYDLNRLDTDLDYAARAAAALASTGITHQKWETWPAAASQFLGGASAQSTLPAAPIPQQPTSPAPRLRHPHVHGPGVVEPKLAVPAAPKALAPAAPAPSATQTNEEHEVVRWHGLVVQPACDGDSDADDVPAVLCKAPKRPAPNGAALLNAGMSGKWRADVFNYQTILRRLGYNISTDGHFGAVTDAKTRHFQGRYGLRVDGVVGPQTAAALARV